MRRYAVINQKGGVGKTTTAANLGAFLATQGNRVLLLDLDPQAHLSLHFDVTLSETDSSIYDVLTSGVPLRDVAISLCEGISLIPADIDLAGAEAELVSVTGREVILREALESVEDEFDVMLVDCPPSLGVLTINALVACTDVLIPLQSQFFALQGLSKLLTNTVMLVRRRINPELRVAGVVLCMHESATRLANEVVDDLTAFLESARGTDVPWAEAKIYETFIRRNVRLAEATSFGQSIFDYAPRSNGARDYARLACEVFPELCATASDDVSAANDLRGKGVASVSEGTADRQDATCTDSRADRVQTVAAEAVCDGQPRSNEVIEVRDPEPVKGIEAPVSSTMPADSGGDADPGDHGRTVADRVESAAPIIEPEAASAASSA